MSRVILTKTNLHYIPSYQLMTQIVQEEDQTKTVIKTPLHGAAKAHVAGLKLGAELVPERFSQLEASPCTRVGDTMQYPFVEGVSWLTILLEAAKQGKDGFLGKWKEFVSRLAPREGVAVPFAPSPSFERLFGKGDHFVGMPSYPSVPLDLTPSNIFRTPDGRDVAVDCEWVVEGPLPVDLLIYHTVKATLSNHQQMLENATEEEVLAAVGVTEHLPALDEAWRHFTGHILLCDYHQHPYELRYIKPVEEFQEIKASGDYHRALAGQLQDAVALLDGLAKARQDNIEQLEALVSEQRNSIEQLDGLAKARQDNIGQLETLVSEQRDSIAQLDALTKAQLDANAKLTETLNERQNAVDELFEHLGQVHESLGETKERLILEHAQVEQLSQWRKESMAFMDEQDAHIQEAEDAAEEKEHQLQLLHTWMEQMKERIQYLEQRNQVVEAELTAGHERELTLQSEKMAMENSRSWRITAPLRKIRSKMKRK